MNGFLESIIQLQMVFVLKEIIFALREWSSNWVGFKEEQSIAPKYDSFDLEL